MQSACTALTPLTAPQPLHTLGASPTPRRVGSRLPDPGRHDSRQAHHLGDQKDWKVDVSGSELRKHTEEQLKRAQGGKLAFNGLQLQSTLASPFALPCFWGCLSVFPILTN